VETGYPPATPAFTAAPNTCSGRRHPPDQRQLWLTSPDGQGRWRQGVNYGIRRPPTFPGATNRWRGPDANSLFDAKGHPLPAMMVGPAAGNDPCDSMMGRGICCGTRRLESRHTPVPTSREKPALRADILVCEFPGTFQIPVLAATSSVLDRSPALRVRTTNKGRFISSCKNPV